MPFASGTYSLLPPTCSPTFAFSKCHQTCWKTTLLNFSSSTLTSTPKPTDKLPENCKCEIVSFSYDNSKKNFVSPKFQIEATSKTQQLVMEDRVSLDENNAGKILFSSTITDTKQKTFIINCKSSLQLIPPNSIPPPKSIVATIKPAKINRTTKTSMPSLGILIGVGVAGFALLVAIGVCIYLHVKRRRENSRNINPNLVEELQRKYNTESKPQIIPNDSSFIDSYNQPANTYQYETYDQPNDAYYQNETYDQPNHAYYQNDTYDQPNDAYYQTETNKCDSYYDTSIRESQFQQTKNTRQSFYPSGTPSRNVDSYYHPSKKPSYDSFPENDNFSDTDVVVAISDFIPDYEVDSDGLEIFLGDGIVVEHVFDDGWAIGVNRRTNRRGAFPMTCLEEGDY
jgi:hypothetical protein